MFLIWSGVFSDSNEFVRGNDFRTLLASAAAEDQRLIDSGAANPDAVAGLYIIRKDGGPSHELWFDGPDHALRAAGREPKPIKASNWGFNYIAD